MSAKYDMYCDRVVTFKRQFTLRDKAKNPIPLSGLRARMSIAKAGAAKPLIVLDSTVGSAIVVDGVNSKQSLKIPTTITSALAEGEYVYDWLLINEAVSPVEVEKFMAGRFIVQNTIGSLT